MPDIDLDFPRDIREVLIPDVHRRYGADRSALVAAFPTYRPRGAVRDLGKALGLPPGEIEQVARMVGFHGEAGEIEGHVAPRSAPSAPASPRWRALASLCAEAMGLPRHASQHPGGMVISTRPLIDVCPVVPAAMEGRQIVQWDKDSCADAGFLKIDLLGLGMLSAVERCVDEIERVRGERVDLSRIPHDDAETFDSIRAAETTGVFQIESRAQMQMLPRTLPADLDDLTVQVALVRPGPIQGGAVHPYIERRKRLREDPSLRGPLRAPAAGAGAEGDAGDDRLPGAGDRGGDGAGRLLLLGGRGAAPGDEPQALRGGDPTPTTSASSPAPGRRGVPAEVAERVWHQIQGFSGFGFPKAHSAAFGLLAYQSAWLRVHYGPEFLCALLNEQPMGFYPPDSLVHEAQRRGIRVAPARRQPQRRPLPGRARARRPDRPDRARLREGGARGGDGGAGRRARARRPLHRRRRPRARARAPAATGSSGWPGPAPSTACRWAGARATGSSGSPAAPQPAARGTPAAAAARAAAGARARGARPLGDDDRRTIARPGSTSASTRWRCCATASARGSSAAPSWRGSRTARRSRSPAWSSPASAPRRRRGSSSCCSKTSAGRST